MLGQGGYFFFVMFMRTEEVLKFLGFRFQKNYGIINKFVYTNKGSETMTKEPTFQSTLTQEEIEKNFENFDVYEGLMAGLQEALEQEKENEKI